MAKKRGCVKRKENGNGKANCADVNNVKNQALGDVANTVRKHPVYATVKRNSRKRKTKLQQTQELQKTQQQQENEKRLVEELSVANVKTTHDSSKRDNFESAISIQSTVSFTDSNEEKSEAAEAELKAKQSVRFCALADIPTPENWEMLLDMDVFKLELTCSSDAEEVTAKESPKELSCKDATIKAHVPSQSSMDDVKTASSACEEHTVEAAPVDALKFNLDEVAEATALTSPDEWPLESCNDTSGSCDESLAIVRTNEAKDSLPLLENKTANEREPYEETEQGEVSVTCSRSQSRSSVSRNELEVNVEIGPHLPLTLLSDNVADNAVVAPNSSSSSQAHGSNNATPQSMHYKTEMCRSYEDGFLCRYGIRCRFAHGFEELRSAQRHPKYKTQLCRTFHSNGFCHYGRRCTFIHNENWRSLARLRRAQGDNDGNNNEDVADEDEHGVEEPNENDDGDYQSEPVDTSVDDDDGNELIDDSDNDDDDDYDNDGDRSADEESHETCSETQELIAPEDQEQLASEQNTPPTEENSDGSERGREELYHLSSDSSVESTSGSESESETESESQQSPHEQQQQNQLSFNIQQHAEQPPAAEHVQAQHNANLQPITIWNPAYPNTPYVNTTVYVVKTSTQVLGLYFPITDSLRTMWQEQQQQQQQQQQQRQQLPQQQQNQPLYAYQYAQNQQQQQHHHHLHQNQQHYYQQQQQQPQQNFQFHQQQPQQQYQQNIQYQQYQQYQQHQHNFTHQQLFPVNHLPHSHTAVQQPTVYMETLPSAMTSTMLPMYYYGTPHNYQRGYAIQPQAYIAQTPPVPTTTVLPQERFYACNVSNQMYQNTAAFYGGYNVNAA